MGKKLKVDMWELISDFVILGAILTVCYFVLSLNGF